jgi:hypothetical protein
MNRPPIKERLGLKDPPVQPYHVVERFIPAVLLLTWVTLLVITLVD